MPALTAPLPAVVVSGPPASGKSTLGRALATSLGAAVLDQDVLTAPLTAVVAGLVADDDLSGPVLRDLTRTARYETVLAAAVDNLRIGRPVVMIAPFTTERRERQAWDVLASRVRDAGGEALLVWLRIGAAGLRARMGTRAAARDAGKLADLDRFLDRTDLDRPVVPCLEVNAELPTDEQCRRVLRQVA